MMQGWVQPVEEEAGNSPCDSTINGIKGHMIERNKSEALVSESLSKHNLASADKTHWFVESKIFQIPVSIIVIANVIQIGMSVDLRGDVWDVIWQNAEYLFAFLFGLEMVIKISLLRKKYFKDPWNLLDFMLAWLAIIDAVTMATGLTGGAANKITILRVLRLTRILRTVRLFKIFKELAILVEVILKSVRTMCWLLLLVALLTYVVAILCVELIGNNQSYPDYGLKDIDTDAAAGFNNFQFFGTIFRSMYSLFNLITLSEWSTITRPIAEMQPYVLIIMGSFIMFTAYGVMNVLIGVMVEHALTANANFVKEKELEYKDYQMHMIFTVATILTGDEQNGEDKRITLEELEEEIEMNEQLAYLLKQVDLPEGCTMKELFLLIDEDGDQTIQREEFVSALHRMLYCSDFQRLCLMQISLNSMKSLLMQVFREVKLIRSIPEEKDTTIFDRRSDFSQTSSDVPPKPADSMNKIDKAPDVNSAMPDDFRKLHCELQEMRAEIGMHLADMQAHWMHCLDRSDAKLCQPPNQSSGATRPPTPSGPPPNFPPSATPRWPEANSFMADMPGMMRLRRDDHSSNGAVAAKKLPGSSTLDQIVHDCTTSQSTRANGAATGQGLPTDVISILSQLQEKVEELQAHSELELSTRRNDLECQAAVRVCCFELAACLSQELLGREHPQSSDGRPAQAKSTTTALQLVGEHDKVMSHEWLDCMPRTGSGKLR